MGLCWWWCWWWGLNYICTFFCFFLVILKFWLFCLKPSHLTIIAQSWLKRWAVIAEKLRQIKENTSHQRERAVPEKRTKRGDLLITFLLKPSSPAAPRHYRSHHLLTSFLSQCRLFTYKRPCFMSSCHLLLLQIYILLFTHSLWAVINMLTS